MNKTSKEKTTKLSTKISSNASADGRNDNVVSHNANTSTPTQTKHIPRSDLAIEYSPILSQSTTDGCDVDVVWDWHSPQSKATFPRRTKRLHALEQEKVPLKRTPSSNQIPIFNKIKEELEALKEQITTDKRNEELPESCLVVDLGGAINSQDESTENVEIEELEGKRLVDLEDLFNDDSLEEQLVLCSQEIEKKFETSDTNAKINKTGKVNSCSNKFDVQMGDEEIRFEMQTVRVNSERTATESVKVKRFNFKNHIKAKVVPLKDLFDMKEVSNDVSSKSSTSNNCSALRKLNSAPNVLTNTVIIEKFDDDSFELALAAFKDEDIELLSQASEEVQQGSTLDRFKDRERRSKCLETGIKASSSAPQLRKTNSFDDSILKPTSDKFTAHHDKSSVDSLPNNVLKEIEKKRRQALAKLEAKKKQSSPATAEEVSPIKCSPDEIEQKRLQALSKLETKRKQEIIEKNRLEALKRLEMNKKRRALQVHNSIQSVPNSLPCKIAQTK